MGIAPGVIVEERAGISLPINASATVPCFIGKWYGLDGKVIGADKGCIKVSYWMDYYSKFSHGPLSATAEIISTPPVDENPDYTYVIGPVNVEQRTEDSSVALKHYFENGGGPCYLLSATDLSSAAEISKLAPKIEEYAEISLLVMGAESTASDSVYETLAALFDKKKGHFLIMHGLNKSAKASNVLQEEAQAAFYYPYLQLSQKYWIDDAGVKVTGYADKESPIEEGASPESISLLELVTRSPSLSQKIRSELDKKVTEYNKDNPHITIPPSAAVAGAYCRTDRERGIWKAPANVAIRGGIPTVRVGEDEQGDLNKKGTNVIRWFDGQGAVIYGARTLVNEAQTDWLYVPVRRLFNQVERDVADVMRFAVFEPNMSATWIRVKSAIEGYLYNIWKLGGLMGSRPEEGYFVQVGKDITMRGEEIEDGKMIVKIGMAAVRPAEFIILQFTQNML